MASTTMRQTAVIALLVVATAATLMLLDHKHRLDVIHVPADTIIRPFATILDDAGHSLRGAGQGKPSDLQAQLTAVTAERDKLLAENARLLQLQDEVAQLRKQLGFQQAHPGMTAVTANVSSSDPNAAHQVLVIDRGSKDGIQKGMAVVTPDFFIGQISDVTPDSAKILLATDASAHSGAMIYRTGAVGVLDGRWQAGAYFSLDHLRASDDVVEGDVVVTSGTTARVPKGLVVGKVSHVEKSSQEDAMSARVVPLIDYSTVRSVTVILSDGSTP